MTILGSIFKAHELKRYAQELPTRLSKNYGASTYYTRPQIDATVAELKLDRSLILYSYAMYLPEAEFEAWSGGSDRFPSYQDARTAVKQYVEYQPTDSDDFYDSRIGSGWRGRG